MAAAAVGFTIIGSPLVDAAGVCPAVASGLGDAAGVCPAVASVDAGATCVVDTLPSLFGGVSTAVSMVQARCQFDPGKPVEKRILE